jgi:hypothetical protein
LTAAAALFLAAASLAGLLAPLRLYPSRELLRSFMPNDAINLVVGLPILLGTMLTARRGRLLGLLFWPGALFFVLYSYLIYLFAMPLTAAYLLFLLPALSGGAGFLLLVLRMDGTALKRRIGYSVPVRIPGGVLAGFGIAFFVRAAVIAGEALAAGQALPRTESGLLAADLLISLTWIVGGIQLWRRSPFGLAAGPGLLFQAAMLFLGLIGVLLLQPPLTGVQLAAADLLGSLLLGVICFVPLGLLIRGIAATEAGRTGAG